ncbi:glycosyltransferase family 4 protein [candidate division WOR-3 bacterium]|nr:glycosyltransferase family 4 protein [candidate division WOR-3 bacterium]
MKKVAFVLSLPTPYRTPLLERIADWKDINFKIFYCSSSDPDRHWDSTLGETESFSEILPVKRVNIPSIGKNLKFNPSIWRRLTEEDFDVVIVGGYFPLTMFFSIVWALIHRIPYIINSESQLLNKRSKWKSFIKKILLGPIVKKASAYLPLGRFQAEYLIHYGADSKKIFYFPNTPDVEFFITKSDKYRRKKDEIKRKLGIEKEYVILFAGRLVKVKGLFTLLRGFKEVKKKYDNVSLLFAGDGVLKKQLERFVKQERIEDVHFAGFASPDKLPRYYAISDIFVLPSNYEPWGVVVNEAMASALPIILSDKVGSRGDLLEEGENGFCFKSGNYKELADTMIRMLSNTEKLKAMGERSREIIRGFDYSYCEENLRKALESLGIVD